MKIGIGQSDGLRPRPLIVIAKETTLVCVEDKEPELVH